MEDIFGLLWIIALIILGLLLGREISKALGLR